MRHRILDGGCLHPHDLTGMGPRHPEASHYPIRAVARLTGISVDTLRAWERRYEAVAPGRSARGRLYTDADVARLKQLAALVGRGHAIGTIAGLSDAELGKLRASSDTHAPTRSALEAEAPLDPVIEALDRYDLDAIETTLNRHAAVLPPRDLVFAVIVPLMREIGSRWESGRLRPSQEHLVSAIVRSVLGSQLRTVSRPQAAVRIVFATPSGERHELGLLSAAVLAASSGYGVVYLGPDVPAADVVHAATTTGARMVIVSATAPGAVTKAEARKLTALPPHITLLIGGPEAGSIVAAIGDRARPIEGLHDVVAALARAAP